MLEKISRREEADLFVAWIAISISFTIIFISPGGLLNFSPKVSMITALVYFGISLVTAGIAFILHEMAHKFTALKYGFWAEFRKNDFMLLVAIALAALVGVVFAAPGATMIYPRTADGRVLTREQEGKISAAGPVTNLLLCIPFFLLLFASGAFNESYTSNLLIAIGMIGLEVNAMIALFNLLPVGPLDGKKVLSWNPGIFLVLIVLSAAIVYGAFFFIGSI